MADRLVGTGVACVTKDYGTGADCSLGPVEIDRDGSITVQGDAVEMGNGIGTAIANRVALHLGGVADEVAVSRIDSFDALGLVSSGDPYTMDQATQDAAEGIRAGCRRSAPRPAPRSAPMSAPRRRPRRPGSSSASACGRRRSNCGASTRTTPGAAVGGGARGRTASLSCPACRRCRWRTSPPRRRPASASPARWRTPSRAGPGRAARFPLAGEDWDAEIDALAVRRGDGAFAAVDRDFVGFPPTDYNRIGTSFASACGTLVRVEIEQATGAIRIAKAYSVLECGEALVPEVVLGQSQGGFAMGVGYALLETLPPFEDGPGNGQWNLGKYLVARASDLPLHGLEIEILPPIAPKEPPKGMAEVVMIPVVPALLNAIFDATGQRFQSLPVTAAMLKEALA